MQHAEVTLTLPILNLNPNLTLQIDNPNPTLTLQYSNPHRVVNVDSLSVFLRMSIPKVFKFSCKKKNAMLGSGTDGVCLRATPEDCIPLSITSLKISNSINSLVVPAEGR